MRAKSTIIRYCLLIIVLLSAPTYATAGTLFQEDFEDSNFASRGWYDSTNPPISKTEHIAGSKSSVEYRFPVAATIPVGGGGMRMKFTPTDRVYVSYFVKYSSNWTGSNRTYHPHEFYLLNNQESDWAGLAYTTLTAYIEQNEGVPLLAAQDGKNIDETQIGVDLTNITENRAIGGCNGDSDGHGLGECYLAGAVHWNTKEWRANDIYFKDTPGPYYKNDWHHVEAYFQLNSIAGGKGMADGVLKYWYDGQLLIDHNDVVLRTAKNPALLFNQFIIAPWIGDGSPVDQTFWVDNLTVGTARVTDTMPPSPPTNLQVP